MAYFLATLGCAILILSPVAGVLVLRSLDQAARSKKAPVQFTMQDFLSLTAYLAIPLSFFKSIGFDEWHHRQVAIFLNAVGCFLMTLMWWISVRTAGRAGITNPSKRLLMIGLVIPLTYLLAIFAGPTLGIYVCSLANENSLTPWAITFIVALVLSFAILRKMVNWILFVDPPTNPSNPWAESD